MNINQNFNLIFIIKYRYIIIKNKKYLQLNLIKLIFKFKDKKVKFYLIKMEI